MLVTFSSAFNWHFGSVNFLGRQLQLGGAFSHFHFRFLLVHTHFLVRKMLERDWISLCRHVQDGFIYVTLIVHTYMLYLIAYKSPKEIGKYKYLMVYVSIFEMAYATFGTVLKPVVLSYTSRIIVLVDARNIWLNRTVTRVINSAICGFYGCTASILTIHFMYRYGSLQMATSSIFEGWKFILLCLLPVCYGIIWSTTVFFVFPEDPGFSELIRNDMWDFFGIHVEDVVYTGMYYYKEDKYRLYGFEFLACFGMFILCFIIMSSLGIVLVFGYRCYNTMNSWRAHSVSLSTKNI